MIKLIKINKEYDNKKILMDINLEVQSDSIVGIMGDSGSGKTTLLRTIAGLTRPDSGKICIDNVVVEHMKIYVEPYLRNVGFIFQDATLWPHMTVKRNIEFGLSKLSKDRREMRTIEVMKQTEVIDFASKYPHQISGGQAKRVALARALAPNPKYLLLDEPLTNLDEKAKSMLLDLLIKVREDNECTYIYVSHQKEEIKYLGSVIYKLEDGRVFKDA